MAWLMRPLLRPPENAENTTIMTSSDGGFGILTWNDEFASSMPKTVTAARKGPISSDRACCQAFEREVEAGCWSLMADTGRNLDAERTGSHNANSEAPPSQGQTRGDRTALHRRRSPGRRG